MDIYEEISSRRKAGQPFVLATVIKTTGATPRAPGAKMLVHPEGEITGTVGGGTFEKLVIEDCLNLMESDSDHLHKKYSFTDSGEDATGMSCGGKAEVFMEVNSRPNRLIVFGGGHICQELVKLARGSGFKITVVDDRPEILNLYDQSVTTIQTNPDYKNPFPSLDSNCYIVIVTRSHKNDLPALAQVINEDCAYIGMIGSKAKIAKVFSSLVESGVDRTRLDFVHTPIGLDIRGEGPYEIAVSILAELIAVKNGASIKRQSN